MLITILSMIKKSKYWSDVVKKHFNKEFVMTKEDNEDFENSTKCWICDNDYIDGDIEVRDCCVTGKLEVLDIEIVISMLNHEIPVIFRNLKNYVSHLIIQELGKFNLKINAQGFFQAFFTTSKQCLKTLFILF